MKRIWLQMLLTAMVPMTVACSAGGDDDIANLQAQNSPTTATYEGEWTVNKQVVDTARLVVAGDRMQLRLPEEYLFSTYVLSFLGDKATPANYALHNVPTKIEVSAQGYSDMSQYMSFSSPTVQGSDMQRLYNPCSFEVTMGGTFYHISLLSKENATAVLQNSTGQWTIGIPVDRFLIRTPSAGESLLKELPSTVTIYYNTKRRIR